jgi:7,8-dihydropterin-6-yl-methyl-4-(beta-D-ribofuranosyl)aminobenzene 5'-phosphate synthase
MTLGKCRGPLLLLLLSLSVLCLAHQALPVSPLGVTPASMTPEATMPADPTGTSPMPTLSAEPASPPTPAGTIVMTIVYDNRPFDPALTTAWGFSCLVRTPTNTVLFDTGGDGAILMANMAALQIDAGQIDVVVLSHNHRDHTGGLQTLLGENDHLTIYVPASFADQISDLAGDRAQVVAVRQPMLITDGIWALGEMGTAVIEQALAVETSQGLAVITGCAHPGLPTIITRALTLGKVDMLIGGFHLQDASLDTIRGVIGEVQSLGVRRVAPSHCTGDMAIREFQKVFGPAFYEAGAGARYEFER